MYVKYAITAKSNDMTSIAEYISRKLQHRVIALADVEAVM